jgi:competence protein ComGC
MNRLDRLKIRVEHFFRTKFTLVEMIFVPLLIILWIVYEK